MILILLFSYGILSGVYASGHLVKGWKEPTNSGGWLAFEFSLNLLFGGFMLMLDFVSGGIPWLAGFTAGYIWSKARKGWCHGCDVGRNSD